LSMRQPPSPTLFPYTTLFRSLVEHFMAHYAAERRVRTPEIAPDAMVAMQSYDWPGNVRQLRNVVERTIILAPGDRIGRIDLDLRSEEHTSELQSRRDLVCRLL